jgi:phosphoglycolate phosphatase-like HAD superfamily hydrolase
LARLQKALPSIAMVRAVILDFDGVILDSVGVKTRTFARLFQDHGPTVVRQVIDYHLANGGVSRFEKFEHIYRNFLHETLSGAESARLGDRFKSLAFDEIVKAPWIPGAQEFLHDNFRRSLLFVASGTPEDELREIIRLRHLNGKLQGAFGSPASKAQILNRIMAENDLARSDVVFVGDAMTDFHAAMESGVKFIGIAPANASPFPAPTRVLPDLRKLAEAIDEITASNFPGPVAGRF